MAWSESRIFPAVPSAGGKDFAPPLQLEHPAPLGFTSTQAGDGGQATRQPSHPLSIPPTFSLEVHSTSFRPGDKKSKAFFLPL